LDVLSFFCHGLRNRSGNYQLLLLQNIRVFSSIVHRDYAVAFHQQLTQGAVGQLLIKLVQIRRKGPYPRAFTRIAITSYYSSHFTCWLLHPLAHSASTIDSTTAI
jgi:hypothetical protein